MNKAPQFILYIDYKAGARKSVDYIRMESKDLAPAMMEAENHYSDDVYMMKIMTKAGATEKLNRDSKATEYKPFVECRWNQGWRINAADSHRAKFYQTKVHDSVIEYGEAV